MAQRQYVEEYLIAIIPELDRNKFNKERRKVEKEIKKIAKDANGDTKSSLQLEREVLKTKREEIKNAKELAKLAKVTEGSTTTASSKGNMFLGFIREAYSLIKETFTYISKQATDFSNKMISASSMFVDPTTRNMMAQFGVSGQTATGLGNVMGLMGIQSASDLRLMTPGQMNLFSKLMNQWTEGMNSIDPNKLSSFNTMIQQMQAEMASAKLELQIEWYKLLIDVGPEIESFYKSIIELIRSFASFINSPIGKGFITGLTSIFRLIVNVVSSIMNIVSGNWGDIGSVWRGDNTTNNSYITITSTSTNTFNGDTNSMYSLATATQESDSNYISTTLLNTGRA